jgi:hypothetical protein
MHTNDNIDPKYRALAAHFNVTCDEGETLEDKIEETRYGSEEYTVEGEPGEYRVLTSSERDEAIEQACDSYIDECILPEIPEAYRGYFDSAAWKRDVDFGGEGDSMISSYDGSVHEQQIDGEWYYIIRVN